MKSICLLAPAALLALSGCGGGGGGGVCVGGLAAPEAVSTGQAPIGMMTVTINGVVKTLPICPRFGRCALTYVGGPGVLSVTAGGVADGVVSVTARCTQGSGNCSPTSALPTGVYNWFGGTDGLVTSEENITYTAVSTNQEYDQECPDAPNGTVGTLTLTASPANASTGTVSGTFSVSGNVPPTSGATCGGTATPVTITNGSFTCSVNE